jgi:hypothetical protein
MAHRSAKPQRCMYFYIGYEIIKKHSLNVYLTIEKSKQLDHHKE